MNDYGQCGVLPENKEIFVPSLLTSFIGGSPISVSCGENHSAATTELGEAFIWGANCGESFLTHQSFPHRIESLWKNHSFVCKISCGKFHNVYMVDKALTQAMRTLASCSKDESAYESAYIKKVLLLLPTSSVSLLHKRLNLFRGESKAQIIFF